MGKKTICVHFDVVRCKCKALDTLVCNGTFDGCSFYQDLRKSLESDAEWRNHMQSLPLSVQMRIAHTYYKNETPWLDSEMST